MFKEYLSKRKAGYDAVGDFVRLASADPRMPDVASWDELKSYMAGRRDSYAAMQAGQVARKEYQATKTKKPEP